MVLYIDGRIQSVMHRKCKHANRLGTAATG